MTELEQQLIGNLSRFAEQYEREQTQLAAQVKTLSEQVQGLTEQYEREQTQLAAQVERLEEDIKKLTRQYANDQKRQKDQFQGFPLQLRKFEKDVQLFVEQVKKESKQRERLESRIEALADLSWRVENLSSAFDSLRENLNVLFR